MKTGGGMSSQVLATKPAKNRPHIFDFEPPTSQKKVCFKPKSVPAASESSCPPAILATPLYT